MGKRGADVAMHRPMQGFPHPCEACTQLHMASSTNGIQVSRSMIYLFHKGPAWAHKLGCNSWASSLNENLWEPCHDGYCETLTAVLQALSVLSGEGLQR